MNRKDLENLGLEKDVIDKIMDYHGDRPIYPPVDSDLEKVINELNKVIEDLKTQINLVSAEIKVKDGKIDSLEKELDATVLSANGMQKKLDEIKKVVG